MISFLKKAQLALSIFGVAAVVAAAVPARADVPWVIKKDHWSEADERNFSKFVESIYDSGCNTVAKCMNGSGNWYRDRDPRGIGWWADCGRFPYLLRVYFAFHNNLPFQSATSVVQRDPNDPNPVLQYSARGNVVTSRTAARTGMDAYRFINRVVSSTFTALYRVDSRIDVSTGKYGDMYHVAISRDYIRPGTVVYDPNGHVATVAKITAEGKVTLLDSHPDNTVSRVPYTGAFRATSPSQSGGFKNWRPLRLIGAQAGANGELNGGRVEAFGNNEAPGYSMEQFVGDQPNPRGGFSTARWSTSDGILGAGQFTDVVRARLSIGAVTYDALKEVKEEVETLCSMMQERGASVQVAITKGIDNNSMPGGRLPSNIYGTSGEWEEFSTPSRDARLKTAVAEFRALVEKIVTLHKSGSSKVIYSGSDLVGDMLKAYDEAGASCNLSYTKSNGAHQAVSFQDMVSRMYKMSFDPYHCVEVRWGASSEAELASCQMSNEKWRWYKAEQRLRNSLERKYDKKMGWTLEDLEHRADMNGQNPAASVGSDTQVPLDARAYLTRIR